MSMLNPQALFSKAERGGGEGGLGGPPSEVASARRSGREEGLSLPAEPPDAHLAAARLRGRATRCGECPRGRRRSIAESLTVRDQRCTAAVAGPAGGMSMTHPSPFRVRMLLHERPGPFLGFSSRFWSRERVAASQSASPIPATGTSSLPSRRLLDQPTPAGVHRRRRGHLLGVEPRSAPSRSSPATRCFKGTTEPGGDSGRRTR